MFGLEIWQLVLLGIAGVTGFTMLLDRKNKTVESTAPTTPQTPTVDNPDVPVQPNIDVVKIVSHWSSFKRQCVKAGLTEAVNKLDEIFPLLIDDTLTAPEPTPEPPKEGEANATE